MLRVDAEVAEAWALDNLGQVRHGAGEKAHKLRVKECPVCGHAKWSTIFNTRMQVLECFRCAAKMPFFDIVRQVERITSDADMAVLLRLKPYTPAGVELVWTPRKSKIPWAAAAPKRPALSLRTGEVWDDFSTDWSSYDGKVLLDYARKRRLTEEWLSSGRIGYFRRGKLAGRLAFVTYENGNPIFAVARAVRPESQPKYKAMEGAVASEVVFNLDLVQEGGRGLVNEGCLSAISSGPGGVAIFGNNISWTQAGKIAMRCRHAVVIVEKGIDPVVAQENAHRIAASGCPDVLIARLATEADPNDDPGQMPEVVAKAAPVRGKGELLRERIRSRIIPPGAKDIF